MREEDREFVGDFTIVEVVSTFSDVVDSNHFAVVGVSILPSTQTFLLIIHLRSALFGHSPPGEFAREQFSHLNKLAKFPLIS